MLRFAVFAMLACVGATNTYSQEGDPGGAVTLVAAPRLVDPDYRGAVLLAVPVDNNRHVGVIINRPTGRSPASLFPEHPPSKLVRDPKYTGSRTSLEGACSGQRVGGGPPVGGFVGAARGRLVAAGDA